MGKFVAKKYVIEVTEERHDEMHRTGMPHEHAKRIADRWQHAREPVNVNAIAGTPTAMPRGVR